ncbi:hypothetical protein [Pantoea dispersa]|uniref:hypothetical protein n=1 Tax=Pantoea dispersa TaxID=59814 RepID=UPI0021C745C3|nr:hypothetical protein [Pantoea dispersa]
MRKYPHSGERWQHEQGWTVTILRLSAAPFRVASLNPEFSHEVLYRYDSDGQVTSSPLAWFEKNYTRLNEAPCRVSAPTGGSGGFSPFNLHPSVKYERWRERAAQQPAEPDDCHYSKFL